jgi:hypothetical protein
VGVLIGAGVLMATVTVLVLVVREVRRLKRTRPLQFRIALVQDAAPQAVTHDLPPEPLRDHRCLSRPPMSWQRPKTSRCLRGRAGSTKKVAPNGERPMDLRLRRSESK